MGQGVLTALPTILAEDSKSIRRRIVVEMAPGNPAFQGSASEITGGSTSVNARLDLLRTTWPSSRRCFPRGGAARWGFGRINAKPTRQDGRVGTRCVVATASS